MAINPGIFQWDLFSYGEEGYQDRVEGVLF